MRLQKERVERTKNKRKRQEWKEKKTLSHLDLNSAAKIFFIVCFFFNSFALSFSLIRAKKILAILFYPIIWALVLLVHIIENYKNNAFKYSVFHHQSSFSQLFISIIALSKAISFNFQFLPRTISIVIYLCIYNNMKLYVILFIYKFSSICDFLCFHID